MKTIVPMTIQQQLIVEFDQLDAEFAKVMNLPLSVPTQRKIRTRQDWLAKLVLSRKQGAKLLQEYADHSDEYVV
jgi:hypothetical protein